MRITKLYCDMCENEIGSETNSFTFEMPRKVCTYAKDKKGNTVWSWGKSLKFHETLLCERCASAVADYIGPVY